MKTVKITPEQRLEIYRECIVNIADHTGLCSNLRRRAIDIRITGVVSIDFFPEIMRQKTFYSENSAFWWPPNDFTSRIKALNIAINQVEQLINQSKEQ